MAKKQDIKHLLLQVCKNFRQNIVVLAKNKENNIKIKYSKVAKLVSKIGKRIEIQLKLKKNQDFKKYSNHTNNRACPNKRA